MSAISPPTTTEQANKPNAPTDAANNDQAAAKLQQAMAQTIFFMMLQLVLNEVGQS